MECRKSPFFCGKPVGKTKIHGFFTLLLENKSIDQPADVLTYKLNKFDHFLGSHPPSPADSGVSDVEPSSSSLASDEESKSINRLQLKSKQNDRDKIDGQTETKTDRCRQRRTEED